MLYTGTDFLPEEQERVDSIIEEQRANMDLPFDELYHTQKKLIQDVIDAEKALEAKVESMPDPWEYYKLDTSKLSADKRGRAEAVLDRFASPFSVS